MKFLIPVVALFHLISHTHKCIFIHIPKCGGTSVEDVIWPGSRSTKELWMGFVSKYHNKYQTGGMQHLLARQVREEVGEEVFSEYFKFTIVRNPWAKVVSQYFYMRQRPDLREYLGMKESDDLKKYLELISLRLHVQWEKQHLFFMDEQGSLMVDFVGRLENIAADSRRIFDRIGIRDELPHNNATAHKHYSEYYDAESKEMVADLYGEDIRLLGYSFESP